jgi:hypothetical protein
MSFFTRKSDSKPPRRQRPLATKTVIRVVERELGSLTLAQWQQDSALCSQSRNVLSSPIVRQMIQVLHNSHPAFQVMVSGDTNLRAMQQARCEGYTMALADFESMGQLALTNEPLEADFGAEEISDKDIEPFKAKKVV